MSTQYHSQLKGVHEQDAATPFGGTRVGRGGRWSRGRNSGRDCGNLVSAEEVQVQWKDGTVSGEGAPDPGEPDVGISNSWAHYRLRESKVATGYTCDPRVSPHYHPSGAADFRSDLGSPSGDSGLVVPSPTPFVSLFFRPRSGGYHVVSPHQYPAVVQRRDSELLQLKFRIFMFLLC